MSSKYIQDYDVPEDFHQILHDYTREILRDQPEDIIQYSNDYFNALLTGQAFNYVSKYNIHRSKQVSHRQYEYSKHENYQQEHDQIGVKSVPPVRSNFLHIDQPKQQIKQAVQNDEQKLNIIQSGLEKAAPQENEIQNYKKNEIQQEFEKQKKEQEYQEKEQQKQKQKAEEDFQKEQEQKLQENDESDLKNEVLIEEEQPEQIEQNYINDSDMFLQINVMQALGLPKAQQDARCCLHFGDEKYETKVIYNENEPKWNETIKFPKLNLSDLQTKTLRVTILQDVDACIGQFQLNFTEENLQQEGQFFINQFFQLEKSILQNKVFIYLQIRFGKEGQVYNVGQFAQNIEEEEQTIRKNILLEEEERNNEYRKSLNIDDQDYEVSFMFNIQVKVGEDSEQKFTYKNSTDSLANFKFTSQQPEILQIIDENIEIEANNEAFIRFKVASKDEEGSNNAYVFANNLGNQDEKLLLFKIEYQK